MSARPEWGDQLRELAATYAMLADTDDRLVELIAKTRAGMPPEAYAHDDMPERATAAAYRLRTMQRLFAEQARAYDEMIAAGGPENAATHAGYQATVERLNALLPTDLDSPDLDR